MRVAHAFDQNNVVNPDDPADLVRLNKDLPVIRELADRNRAELGVKSLCNFHREHLYELEGFRTLFGNTLVARIKSREECGRQNCQFRRHWLSVFAIETTSTYLNQ